MEVSSEVLSTIEVTDDKDIMEVIKQMVSNEDIIVESEATEDSTEIEEIIEIIEEVEESNDAVQNYDNSSVSQDRDLQSVENETFDESSQGEEFDRNSTTTIYTFDEEGSMFKTEYEKENTPKAPSKEPQKVTNKQVIAYDVDEDWQDEDMEQLELEELDQNSDSQHSSMTHVSTDKKSVNNRLDGKNSTELNSKTEKVISNVKKVDNNVGHEIVKNTENNLVYTVLEPKKQTSSGKQHEKFVDAQFIKVSEQVEQLDEGAIPVEGTIYYDKDIETVYVAHAVDDGEQYQYDPTAIEQDEQAWESENVDTNQSQEQEQEEDNSQDQIFLHEDEDGQLYFKDENGALQPVYLTEDGNYAIAENSDEQDSKEGQNRSHQNSRQSEEESFTVPDLDLKGSTKQAIIPASALNDLDNEDNTVTISLIISEDEHGQKRTQVIIPTTDNLKCDTCNKTFKTSFQLLRHNRLKHAREEDITTRNFPCDLCPKRYPDQNSLARHRKTHTGDRPFQCLECHKTFPTATALRRHLTLHNSQSRPLPCIYCGRRFVEKASLQKHEQSHLPGDQKSHTCDICHKTFMNANDLSMHKKYHDPDKKFDCEVCGREFNRLNNLQRHMMVHQQQQGANEEILSCDVCGITYKFMSSLTRHMVTTHMNPEKLRQQAEEQRRKRENNYRRYLENRKMYETQGGYGIKRSYHHNARILTGNNDEMA